jgi:hypothetical protein
MSALEEDVAAIHKGPRAVITWVVGLAVAAVIAFIFYKAHQATVEQDEAFRKLRALLGSNAPDTTETAPRLNKTPSQIVTLVFKAQNWLQR